MLSGVKAQVAIKLFGDDFGALQETAQAVEAAVRPIAGVRDLYVEPQVRIPTVEVKPRREALATYGLSVADISDTVELAMGNHEVSRMIDGRSTYGVTLGFAPADRAEPADIESLYLPGEAGVAARLGDVAEVRFNRSPNLANHERTQRRMVVQHNVAGRAIGDVVAEVEATLADLRAGAAAQGIRIELGGQFEAQRSASRRIMVFALLALALMGLVLAMHFRSFNLALQVLASIPLAVIGGAFLLGVSGQPLSVAALVGFVSLGGIAARNAILLVDHAIHLHTDEGVPHGPGLLIQAGRERLVPVAMTALTSGIALLPLALAAGEPGKELLHPVAIVIIGGLLSATMLDLFVRPALLSLFSMRHLHASPEKRTRQPIRTKCTKP